MSEHDGLDKVRQQIDYIHKQGFDGGGLEDAPETDEQRKARRDFFAQYDNTPPVEVDEDGDPVDADPVLLAAAQTMYDASATPDDIEAARQVLLDSVGGFDEVDDEDDAPTTRAERIAEIAQGVRKGMKPLTGYEQPGELDDEVAHRSAVDSVAREIAIQTAAKRALGIPGYADESGPSGPRSAEEIAAISAVRARMLEMKGVSPADTMNAPEVDAEYERDVAEDYAEWDRTLGLEPGASAAQAAKDDAAFDAGGLE